MDCVKGSKISCDIHKEKEKKIISILQLISLKLKRILQKFKVEKKSKRNQFIHSFRVFFYRKKISFFFPRLQSIVLFDQNVTNWMKNVFVWCRWIESRSATKKGTSKNMCFFLLNRTRDQEKCANSYWKYRARARSSEVILNSWFFRNSNVNANITRNSPKKYQSFFALNSFFSVGFIRLIDE